MTTLRHPDDDLTNSPYAQLDLDRARRKGVPEVVLSSTKSTAQSLTITASFLERTGRAILSRVPPELEQALRERYEGNGFEWYAASRMAVVRRNDFTLNPTGGCVGILTAGTSDQPVAEEAAVLCREMGCTVHLVQDVGVAGIHRLFAPLRRLLDEDRVDVIIVAAGMDGALPSVVSGLADVPVIGVPTSVGYGMGGQGQAALLSMLQTCAPGLAVVNIDNGVGAGAMAGLIANRAAAARRQATREESPGASAAEA
ncbi:MAG TPA: nickel pincer cofactor biosynthesis protein LarB [Chloroflexi bacterium]|jgi:NCAIR mutase (PurE)-related protein|nr:nickel pincer cofactor biosynthesis protein LarB [Chloroflexota bacterium]